VGVSPGREMGSSGIGTQAAGPQPGVHTRLRKGYAPAAMEYAAGAP
jgi:hypothetical protein